MGFMKKLHNGLNLSLMQTSASPIDFGLLLTSKGSAFVFFRLEFAESESIFDEKMDLNLPTMPSPQMHRTLVAKYTVSQKTLQICGLGTVISNIHHSNMVFAQRALFILHVLQRHQTEMSTISLSIVYSQFEQRLQLLTGISHSNIGHQSFKIFEGCKM